MGEVLDILMRELPLVEAKAAGRRVILEQGMAARLIFLVLGRDWYQKRVMFRPDPDDWMLNGNDAWLETTAIPDDVRRIVYTHRVVRLADALYTLITGQAKGLDLLRRRLQTRPTKPSFIETEIASLLVFQGFELEVVGEKGKRGDDFDFLATRGGITVSIEVTSKNVDSLSPKTLRNTLFKKRNQVPPGQPAVLYIHIPAKWMRDARVTQSIFNEALIDFMTRSRRFNAVIFVYEEVIPWLDGGFPRMALRACFNERPRWPFPERNLFEAREIAEGNFSMARSFLDELLRHREKVAQQGD